MAENQTFDNLGRTPATLRGVLRKQSEFNKPLQSKDADSIQRNARYLAGKEAARLAQEAKRLPIKPK